MVPNIKLETNSDPFSDAGSVPSTAAGPKCKKCGHPTKGHLKPRGKNCQQPPVNLNELAERKQHQAEAAKAKRKAKVQSEEAKAINRERQQSEEAKAKRQERDQSEEGKAKIKEREQSEEAKAID